MAKASKGSVSVQVLKGRLRLAWRVGGDRYFLSLNLADNSTNRGAAELKARLIERDIALENFDPTLERYKPNQRQQTDTLTAVDLFEKFASWKKGKVDDRTLEKYRALQVRMIEGLNGALAATLAERKAEEFKEFLLSTQQPVTVVDRISMLKSCWKWGIKQGLVTENPWADIRVRVPPRQKPRPLTQKEIPLIIRTFREMFPHYADFVEFLLGSGCRTGEVIGLRWRHINETCSEVWIGEIWTRGKQKPVKTYQPRSIPLSPRLQQILQSRKPPDPQPDDLVFTGIKGGPIDDGAFRKRYWAKVSMTAGIPYRKPYITRATLVSHALDSGMSPAEVAELTGHSVDTLYKHYAGNIKGRSRLPDLPQELNWLSDDE